MLNEQVIESVHQFAEVALKDVEQTTAKILSMTAQIMQMGAYVEKNSVDPVRDGMNRLHNAHKAMRYLDSTKGFALGNEGEERTVAAQMEQAIVTIMQARADVLGFWTHTTRRLVKVRQAQNLETHSNAARALYSLAVKQAKLAKDESKQVNKRAKSSGLLEFVVHLHHRPSSLTVEPDRRHRTAHVLQHGSAARRCKGAFPTGGTRAHA